jgi:hypothetical protein
MMKDGSDYKEELLQEPKLIMIVTYDLSTAVWNGKMENYIKTQKTKGYKVIGMTNSSATEIRKSKKNTDLRLTTTLAML